MSFKPDSPWRGCAANFPQPVNEEDEREAERLVRTVCDVNCHFADPPLPDIVYRSSRREADILRHVYRWDSTPFQEVFENGFQARRQQDTSDEIYYNLNDFVHNSGRPLDSSRPTIHAFVSTTLSSTWHPSLVAPETWREVYRYEIFAPGGIWVAQTLRDQYGYPSQDEVCFVAGIAPQYIRSAQLFRLTVPTGSRYTIRERVNDLLRVNGNYDPQSHPSRCLNIRRPIFDYVNLESQNPEETRALLRINIYKPRVVSSSSSPKREKRQVSANSDPNINWYAGNVSDFASYINAAFRSSIANEAYLFMKNEYVKVDYAPGSTDDTVLNGPLLICDGFPSLSGTAFAEHEIDSAFGSHNKAEAFIFSGNLCAQINYAPGTLNDKIIKGPTTIAAMFPFLTEIKFESGIDAAFEATTRYEAYLFKDDHYALINYDSDAGVIVTGLITERFASLKDTIFKSGIQAAFASHRTDEAYLFKEDSYALINFTKDEIIGGVKNIVANWRSLSTILPRKNHGLDVHNHTKPDADRDHDEF
ncbi:hypothetical protein ACSBR1_029906 [Camellia fascicularis]